MSVVKPPSQSADERSAEPSGSRWRRRGRRAGRPGASILARGEPALWFTAGALALAIAMIVGLIGLIVVAGGRTFWPSPLMKIRMVDGRVLLGEITDRETYTLPRERLVSLPEEVRARVGRAMGPDDKIPLRRIQLRVANKRIHGASYVWIPEVARVGYDGKLLSRTETSVRADGPSHPQWAMTIERQEWGPFLGILEATTIETIRPVSGAEEQLAGLIAFLEEHSAELDESAQAVLDEALAHLREEYAATRAAGTKAFLAARAKMPEGRRSIAILESGEEHPLAEVAASEPIAAVRTVIEGPETSWNIYQRIAPQIAARQEIINEIERDRLGDLSRELEAARIATVRAGLGAEKSLEPMARRLAEYDAARAALLGRIESRRQMIAAIVRRFGTDSELAGLFQQLATRLETKTRAEITRIEDKIAAIEQRIPAEGRAAVVAYRQTKKDIHRRTISLVARLTELEEENAAYSWRLTTADGTSQLVPFAQIVRAFPANQLGFWESLGIYGDRWAEFLMAEPREANMAGGVWPAICGTVVMTLIMTIAVVPFGVLAALYLREYAKAGPIVSAVRIAVNNLAGVPSIVFGVFGLGFFCYVVGAQLDQFLYPAYAAQNTPVFQKGGLLWASLTLALLTLPVVIVATEEALAAVPNSMREGSYACGASKWQTIRRIVLPRALPGIMTGTILAMARGAGEVAPLMLVGAVKIAPAPPIDGNFPFIHPSRSFMHLGFHIYDLGFQSPDSEAAQPMVFTTTLLLIAIIGVLNIVAIAIRGHLRRRFSGSQF